MNFEHLDDTEPFVPDPALRDAVRTRADQLRRRSTIRRILLGSGTLAVVLLLLAGAMAWRSIGVERVQVAFSMPPISMEEPFDVLAVGLDGGVDGSGAAASNADVILVVRVDPAARTIRVLSVPRDLHPTSAGATKSRLASIYRDGGPQALIDAIGLPVSSFVALTPQAMVDVANAIDGIDLAISTDVRDAGSGLSLTASSCTRVRGDELLALVRSRRLETRAADGKWRSDRSGDAGRRMRQLVVLDAIVHQLPRIGGTLGSVDEMVGLAQSHLTVDARLGTIESLGTMLALARWVSDPQGVSIASATVPTEWTEIDATTLLVETPDAHESVIAWLENGTFPPSMDEAITAGPVVPEMPFGPCRN